MTKCFVVWFWYYNLQMTCSRLLPLCCTLVVNLKQWLSHMNHVYNYSNWRIGRDRGESAWLWQDGGRKDWNSLRTFIQLASSTETFACYHQKLSCKVWHEVLDFVCSFLALVRERERQRKRERKKKNPCSSAFISGLWLNPQHFLFSTPPLFNFPTQFLHLQLLTKTGAVIVLISFPTTSKCVFPQTILFGLKHIFDTSDKAYLIQSREQTTKWCHNLAWNWNW